MKNKFNNLTSKEWLPFQKSWFKYESDEVLYDKNIGFFNKLENGEAIGYYGPDFPLFERLAKARGFRAEKIEGFEGKTQFILFDIRKELDRAKSIDAYRKIKRQLFALVKDKTENLSHRRFVGVLAKNRSIENSYYPFAWDLAKQLGSFLSLKDEKIGCLETEVPSPAETGYFQPRGEVFYSLYFRKDERSPFQTKAKEFGLFNRNRQEKGAGGKASEIPAWFILKPQRRKKKEILHPAKYPEDLVEMFVQNFTQENDNVFDPMSGTGSTQIGALKLKRNAYGTELSSFFADIAQTRCREFLDPTQKEMFREERPQDATLLNKDARFIAEGDFPPIDYLLTSPPYWDMLNMKGAENQAKRIKKGLKTNYSDNPEDLGNIEDYQDFLKNLRDIYFHIAQFMKPKSYLCIVVKNIKKKGSNYPFAWDLSALLQEKFVMLPEVFWVQDDISIAPYGYGNTWVSNTFHQYCLTFQIPENEK